MNMTPQVSVEGSSTALPDPGLASRFFGILLSPGETFRAVAARPRVLGMLLLTTAVAVATSSWFFNTEVGQLAWEDQVLQFGPASEQQMAFIENMRPYVGYMVPIQLLFGIPFIMLFAAGILYVVFNTVLAGEATFKHVLAVVAHAGAVNTVHQLFVMPLNYYQESISSRTNLAVFFPMIEEGTFVARLLGTIDLFYIWWVVVLAIGLAVLYRRRTGPIAAGLFIVYAVTAIAIAAIFGGGGDA